MSWTSNLAVSSLYGIQFMFDFDFNWTRIEASCDEGRLQQEQGLRWTPEPDTAEATIVFTVYDGETAQYCGSISIARTAQPSEIENTYTATLNCPGLSMTAKGSNMGATISQLQ